jgi:hypothetical protein
MAEIYFQTQQGRLRSRLFYKELSIAAEEANPHSAETITRKVMRDSLRLWKLVEHMKENMPVN